MITKEEYLLALELVDKYHRQFEKVDITRKTLVDDWINEHHRKLSGRLIKGLEVKEWGSGDRVFKYMEDVTERVYLCQRNNGSTSWDEFERVSEEIEQLK